MSEDRRRPGQYTARRDESLRRWIAHEVHPFSALLRPRLDAAGLGGRVRTGADLARLAPLTRSELADGRGAVLTPDEDARRRHAPPLERIRLALRDLTGGAVFAHDDVPVRFKPLLWTLDGDLPVAWSAADLELLGDLGRRALGTAGVRPGDRVLVLGDRGPGPGVGTWQLVLGCRAGGVALLHAGDRPAPPTVEPTVLAGTAEAVVAHVRRVGIRGAHLAVVNEGPPPDAAQRAELAAAGLRVAAWWAPPGARALWSECAAVAGFHTWPVHELVEVVPVAGSAADDGWDLVRTGEASAGARVGELLWSAVGWRGSVWLRLRTGVTGRIDEAPCRVCGRTTPRVVRVDVAAAGPEPRPEPATARRARPRVPLAEPVPLRDRLARGLDGLEGVADWIAVTGAGADGNGRRLRLLVRPERREGAGALRRAAAERTGAEVLLLPARRFRMLREAVGDERVVAAADHAQLLDQVTAP